MALRGVAQEQQYVRSPEMRDLLIEAHPDEDRGVVIALITSTEGLPITYEAFPGHTHEIRTLLPVIKKLAREFEVESVDFAADRGKQASYDVLLEALAEVEFSRLRHLKSGDLHSIPMAMSPVAKKLYSLTSLPIVAYEWSRLQFSGQISNGDKTID